MTIRRAQGSTLDCVGVHFDRRCADRGYAYVASSRVRRRSDLWLVGRTRRTDWLPVGMNLDGEEQLQPGIDSASSDSEYDSDAFEHVDSSSEDESEYECDSDAFAHWEAESAGSGGEMSWRHPERSRNHAEPADDDAAGLYA
eukprot:1364562-Karenia_brevis.AAC.1